MPVGSSSLSRPSKLDALEVYRALIVQWRTAGMDLRAIAAKVKAAGCRLDIDHNVIARFCKRHGIVPAAASAPTVESPVSTPSAPETPAAMIPEQGQTPDPDMSPLEATLAEVVPVPPQEQNTGTTDASPVAKDVATEEPEETLPRLWPGAYGDFV